MLESSSTFKAKFDATGASLTGDTIIEKVCSTKYSPSETET